MTNELVTFRCYGCIRDLEEHNPYIYPDGTQVPLDRIEVVEVPISFCEQNGANFCHKPRLQPPVFFNKSVERPWRVKFWENADEREQGISSEFESYESFDTAYTEVFTSARVNGWAAAEIYLDIGERQIPVYLYDAEESKESSFISYSEVQQ